MIITNETDFYNTTTVHIYYNILSNSIIVYNYGDTATASDFQSFNTHSLYYDKLKLIDCLGDVEGYEFIHRNDINSKKVFKEGFIVKKIKKEFTLIENNKYIRKILRCDRKGIGLRLRRDL